MLQRERERLNGLITECRRQMASLQAASKAQAAAYAQRKAGGAAKAEAARAEAEAATVAAAADPLLAFSATARWTGAAGAAVAADVAKPSADATASPSTPRGSRADAQISASKTALGSAAREPHVKASPSPPASASSSSSLGSARHSHAVRTRLFGAGGGAGGDDGAPTLPPQDDALVSVRPAGLAPAARFRNWARATAEEREAALQAENAELLTALQMQLARCGALEASVAALRAENVQLRYSKPVTSTARTAVARPQSAGRARPRTPTTVSTRAPAAAMRVVAAT